MSAKTEGQRVGGGTSHGGNEGGEKERVRRQGKEEWARRASIRTERGEGKRWEEEITERRGGETEILAVRTGVSGHSNGGREVHDGERGREDPTQHKDFQQE